MTDYNNSAKTLDQYVDQSYFGMLSLNPDTSIKAFVNRYLPASFKKYDNGGWTAYAPGVVEESKFFTVADSYIFSAHPFFNGHFKSGQLVITQNIFLDEKWSDTLVDIKLWFEFDEEEDAQKSYSQLVDTFSRFNALSRMTTQQGLDIAEFTDKASEEYYSSIQVILATDYSLRKSIFNPAEDEQKMITTPGYKVLIEVGNDLY